MTEAGGRRLSPAVSWAPSKARNIPEDVKAYRNLAKRSHALMRRACLRSDLVCASRLLTLGSARRRTGWPGQPPTRSGRSDFAASEPQRPLNISNL